LEDVALFGLSLFHGLWHTQASDKWEERKENAFYQILHYCEMLGIQSPSYW
jgi:hypothetical protein